MKIIKITLLLTFTAICIACNTQKNLKSDMKNTSKNSIFSKLEKIELTEQTRGINRLFIFTPKDKTTILNGNQTSLVMSISDWGKICKEVDLIELSAIDKMESPTTGRFSDSALSSTITITVDGKKYQSAGFDAGIPNDKLRPLYNILKYPTGVILQKAKNKKH